MKKFLNIGVVDETEFVDGAVIESKSGEGALCVVKEYYTNEFKEKEYNELGELDIPTILSYKGPRAKTREIKRQMQEKFGYNGKIYISESMVCFLEEVITN